VRQEYPDGKVVFLEGSGHNLRVVRTVYLPR